MVNDYYEAFKGYKATAQVYDINSRKLFEKSVTVDLPEDGVANDVLTVEFPEGISQVHFVNLILRDAEGKVVSTNFYWRSNDKFSGKPCIDGPCTSGFDELYYMKKVKLQTKVSSKSSDGRTVYTVQLKNNSGRISFFNRVQLYGEDGQPVRPSFYSDNFVTLMPGEAKTITIETAVSGKGTVKTGSVLNVFKTEPEK